ncbi:MAG: GntR family transcriptional regulator [Clostridiaceae bacterium]|nr:GntR family transcriptional regulator [Clostridiaceae bacterium]
MNKKVKISTPRYQQIALDIASNIVKGHYEVGEKIYTRSVLSNRYGVSAETVRRAICILSDVEIVEVSKGSGVTIKSYEKAINYVKQYKDVRTVNDLKREILGSVERQHKENQFLKERLSELFDKTDRFRAINPFAPFEITIDGNCLYLSKTISDINFWHNTLATIVAIKRGDVLMMSPGPYAVFAEGDVFYFVGDENCQERVKNFLFF